MIKTVRKDSRCGVCNSKSIDDILITPELPISTRFLIDSKAEEYKKRLNLILCKRCGLLQLFDFIQYRELIPRYPWIDYNEPEDHLDETCRMIIELKNPIEACSVAGVSYKDDSSLDRLRNSGADRVWRIDPESDLNISDEYHNIESVQNKLDEMASENIIKAYGKADIMIVRHILEHTHDINKFAKAIKKMVDPCSLIMFEVPDCSESIKRRDYTMLWEDHTFYFTPTTFVRTLNRLGFHTIKFISFELPRENSLVAITRVTDEIDADEVFKLGEEDVILDARAYSGGLEQQQAILQEKLKRFRRGGKRVALFGAGHLSCMFINIMACEELIDVVIDDDSEKQNYFMPGSRTKIKPSNELTSGDIELCLLGVSTASEEKIRLNNMNFLDSGGIFSSIFPQSEGNIFSLGE